MAILYLLRNTNLASRSDTYTTSAAHVQYPYARRIFAAASCPLRSPYLADLQQAPQRGQGVFVGE